MEHSVKLLMLASSLERGGRMVLPKSTYLQYKYFFNFEQQMSAVLHGPKLLTYITNHFNFEQQMSPHPDILMVNNK